MRKFTANYLVTASGTFLKNGIVIAEENGTAIEFIDTTGDLKEIAQLTFHNGILFTESLFSKTDSGVVPVETDDIFQNCVIRLSAGLEQLSLAELIDLEKQVQLQFPEMKIDEIVLETTRVLLNFGGFTKQILPGIFLLTGADLPKLRFTPHCKLKKIL